jgi:hypothetical protein
MALVYGSTHFVINAGQTFNIITAFNGNLQSGGDYVGPMVAIAVPDANNQSVDISTTKVEFLSQNSDGLTSQCLYHYSFTNQNSFAVSLRLDKFFDG